MGFSCFVPLEIPDGLRRLALAAWVVAIVFVIVFSLAPHLGPPGEYDLDKLCHMIAYGTLAGLPFAVFRERRAVLWAAVLMFPLGVALEVLQGYVQRDPSVFDALADGVGVALGIYLGPFARRVLNRWFGHRQNAPAE